MVWFVAPMGTLSAAYLMAYLDKETWIRLLVWLVIGLTIYFTYSRSHSLLAGKRVSG
jgi:APA family basic amino acid/polyamine antiporter